MRMCGDGYVGAFPLFIINMRSRHGMVQCIQDSDVGESQRKCVRCMQGWCCGFVFDDVDSCQDVPQYKVMKYLVFGTILSSLLSKLIF